MKNQLALAVLLAIMSSSATAKWVQVGGSEIVTIYADPATIRRAGNRVRMWAMLDFKVPQALDASKPYLSVRTQTEYDCKEEAQRITFVSFYAGSMGSGEVLSSSSGSAEWVPAAPDTSGGYLENFACKKP